MGVGAGRGQHHCARQLKLTATTRAFKSLSTDVDILLADPGHFDWRIGDSREFGPAKRG